MTGDSVENHLVKLEANLQQIPDDYIESFTQVIVREKIHQGTKLQLKLMSSRFGLPKFTQSELWVSLMTHDQREIIAPVEIGKDNLKAVFTDFPNGPDQAMIMKVLEKVNGKYYSVYAPIRGYEWSN